MPTADSAASVMYHPLQYFRDGPRYFSYLPRGIDDMDPVRFARCSREVSGAHPFEECEFLAFESIPRSTAISDPLVAELDRQVEQYRKIRPQLLLHPRFYFGDAVGGHASASALIGVRCVRKTIAKNRLPRGQRRPYHLRDMLGPRREHQ